jgi:hypothetical protein
MIADGRGGRFGFEYIFLLLYAGQDLYIIDTSFRRGKSSKMDACGVQIKGVKKIINTNITGQIS